MIFSETTFFILFSYSKKERELLKGKIGLRGTRPKQLKTGGGVKALFNSVVSQKLQLIFKTDKCFDSHFTFLEERQGCTQGPDLRQAPESRDKKLGPRFPVLSSSCPT